MDEVIIEPQIEVEGDVSIMQMDIETSNDEKDPSLIEDNEVKGEMMDLVAFASEGETNLEPYEGMEFESEEAVRTFYSAYARHVGFRIRISRYTRSRRDNSIISRLIVCSKEGFRENRGNGNDGVFGERKQQRQRAVTRVGCKAMLMVKRLAPGKWAVSKFVKEHNHGPVPPRKLDVRVIRKEEEEEDLMEESNPNVLSDGGGEVNEPLEGMEFDSEEDVRNFYINYARQMGFRARISKYCRSRKDNSIISRQIVCSKEGFRELRAKKEESDDGRVKRPRVITRIGCKAMIIVKKLNSGKWVVSRFDKEHNHALLTSKKEPLLLQLTNDSTEKGLVTYVGGDDVLCNARTISSNGCFDGSQSTSRESLTSLYNQLCYEAIKYAQEGAESEEIYNVAMSALKEAAEKVAAAKRNPAKVSKGLNGSNEAKKAVSRNELLLMQEPVKFVLIPSASLASDSKDHSIESPVMLNISNGQGINIPSPVSVLKQQSAATHSMEKLSSNGATEHIIAVQNSQNSNCVRVCQTKAKPGNGCNVMNAGASEARMIAFPALPVTLYMPVMGSLSESSSCVPMPGASTNSAYTVVAAPIEASCVVTNTESQLNVQKSEAPAKDQSPRSYSGPNPQVHATAIAAGARIIPPEEAAALIKAIEARAKSSKSAFGSRCKQFTTNAAPSPSLGSKAEWGPATYAEGVVQDQAITEDMRLHEAGEGIKEMEVAMMDHSAVYDSACEDHLVSNGGS